MPYLAAPYLISHFYTFLVVVTTFKEFIYFFCVFLHFFDFLKILPDFYTLGVNYNL